jgi:hypothetical protein
MAPPRHLWSGDWISESARAADELARRRAQTGEPAQTAEPDHTREPNQTGEPDQARELARPVADPAVRDRHTPPRPRRRRLKVVALLIAALAVGAAVVLAAGPFDAGSGSARSARPGAPAYQSARPWLGLTTTSSPAGAGALVAQVASGGPAEQAGLQPGDVVTAVNGQQVAGPSDIAAVVDSQLVGNEVLIQIERGGQLQTIGVTLAERPAGSP